MTGLPAGEILIKPMPDYSKRLIVVAGINSAAILTHRLIQTGMIFKP